DLQIELLRARPTTLGEAFSLACIIEAHFEAIVHEEKATVEKKQSIKEIVDTITSLQSEVASLKAKGSLDANKEIKNDHTLVHELEKQEEKLSMELQLKNNFREALETTSKDLKKTMLDLNPTLHDLQEVKTNLMRRTIGKTSCLFKEEYGIPESREFSRHHLEDKVVVNE
nr:myosin heavy chain-related protein [Tanacetum cinerariifolium]